MPKQFKLPEIAESIDTATVIKVLVSVGDSVEVDDPVIEAETSKAATEVPTSVGGVVKEIHVSEGEEIKVGDPIITFEDGGEAEEPGGEEKEPEETAKEAEESEEPADAETEEEPEAEAEEEEAETEEEEAQPARAEAKEEPQAETEEEEEEPSAPETDDEPEAETEAPKAEAPSGKGAESVPAAPSVRRLARELGVDLAAVKPSGPQGRVTKEDVEAHAKGGGVPAPAAAAAKLPDFEIWGSVRREAMSTIRRLTAEHMARAWSQVPHVTQFEVADITELEESRKALAPRVEKAGAKLTITAIIARITTMALRKFPKLNASIDVAAREVVYKDYINIGIAVDTPRGLLVPVIKGADAMNVTELAQTMGEMAQRARDGKIKPDEIEGGTFTITNLGSIGGTHFTPIINWPEVAILGAGRARMQAPACPAEGPRLILPLSLSYDHRLIDGAEGIRFLHWIAEALEQPLLALLED